MTDKEPQPAAIWSGELTKWALRALGIFVYADQFVGYGSASVDTLGWKVTMGALVLGGTLVVVGWWDKDRPRRALMICGGAVHLVALNVLMFWFGK